jgi:hypothetical protein
VGDANRAALDLQEALAAMSAACNPLNADSLGTFVQACGKDEGGGVKSLPKTTTIFICKATRTATRATIKQQQPLNYEEIAQGNAGYIQSLKVYVGLSV